MIGTPGESGQVASRRVVTVAPYQSHRQGASDNPVGSRRSRPSTDDALAAKQGHPNPPTRKLSLTNSNTSVATFPIPPIVDFVVNTEPSTPRTCTAIHIPQHKIRNPRVTLRCRIVSPQRDCLTERRPFTTNMKRIPLRRLVRPSQLRYCSSTLC